MTTMDRYTEWEKAVTRLERAGETRDKVYGQVGEEADAAYAEWHAALKAEKLAYDAYKESQD